MKRLFLSFAFVLGLLQAQATPQNLYEQLCEINQEWHKNRAIAESMGFLNLPPIAGEQNILSFHIETLWQIFRNRDASVLSPTRQQARANNLRNLSEYAQLRDCPRNYYLPYRNPVFIDHEGRYCAVGYLMKQTGKQAFCEAVQQASNFIFVRQITHPEFHAWQHESGLSLDELAWIQPAYAPSVLFIEWDRRDANGHLISLDSLQSLKIYNLAYDQTDMLNAWGSLIGNNNLFDKFRKQYPKYADMVKPKWAEIEEYVACFAVYKNELYVGCNQNLYDTTTQVQTLQTFVMRWNKNGTWEKVWSATNQGNVQCFFESRGKLCAGGGYDKVGEWKDEVWNFGTTHSLLVSFNGRAWKVSEVEYGGYILGLVYKNQKRYLAISYFPQQSKRAPINQPKKVEAMSEEGK